MAYQAEIEDGDLLSQRFSEACSDGLLNQVSENDAIFVDLSSLHLDKSHSPYNGADEFTDTNEFSMLSKLHSIGKNSPDNSIIGVLTKTELLPYIYSTALSDLHYQRSIAIRLQDNIPSNNRLSSEFFSLAFFTKGHDVFSISKIREAYRYCPSCEKTTKDYGGKKHLYHSYGTLQRDVWKHPDIQIDPKKTSHDALIARVRDTLSSGRYDSLLVISPEDLSQFDPPDPDSLSIQDAFPSKVPVECSNCVIDPSQNKLHNGDSLDLLAQVPDCSVDLVFLDPPYNIGKEYTSYDDDKSVPDYHEWCYQWLEHSIRVLDKGGHIVLMNVPENSYRHYLYLRQRLELQNWICWDSMSRPPAGNIMPTNYPILVFSKGSPDPVNYSSLEQDNPNWLLEPDHEFERKFVYPLDDNYCKRNSCIKNRRRQGVVAVKELTDLWTDVYRLKHNSQREDHPTMLPPKLMRRLLWLFTDETSTVLDPFNGVGTTTLTAAQMGRNYTGFEISEQYYDIAEEKHSQLNSGADPFSKSTQSISPPSSNSTEYKIPKRDLQLDVKNISENLGKIPTKDEVEEHSRYAIEYYEDYFESWSEVTKAAKTTGMSETRKSSGPSQRTLHSYNSDDEDS